MGSMIGKPPLPYNRLVIRAPKGYVPILVGREAAAERFLVHVKQLKNPSIMVLLETAADELGYKHEGILRILCDVDYFQEVVNRSCSVVAPQGSHRCSCLGI